MTAVSTAMSAPTKSMVSANTVFANFQLRSFFTDSLLAYPNLGVDLGLCDKQGKPSRDKQRGDKHTESPPDCHLHTLSSSLPVFERYRPILRII